MKTADAWKAQYEAAFLAANGSPAKVVDCGKGWFRVEWPGDNCGQRHRRCEFPLMTARLEQRAAGRAP